ncbi:MAG: hypothetical protein U9R47_08255 [Actinomycetota bacterium]|nr:hypothetical protein [Actinomycetota bacterium]
MMNQVPPSDAADLIAHAEDARRRTRDALDGAWFPMLLFGTVTLASAAVAWRYGGESLAVFWAVAGPAGAVATGVFYGLRAKRTGVARSPLPYLGVVAVLLVGAFVLPAITTGTLREVISAIWVGACYVAFGRLDRSWSTAMAGGAVVGLILVLLALDPSHLASWAAVVSGTLFLGTGLWLKLHEKPE